jgi:ribose transport system permease protein
MSGLFAAIAGIVFIARLDAAEPIIGETFAVQAIAAAAIGRTSFSGGVGNVFGTAIGALILTMIMNGLNIWMVPVSWQYLVTGAVILLAVLMDRKSVRIDKE